MRRSSRIDQIHQLNTAATMKILVSTEDWAEPSQMRVLHLETDRHQFDLAEKKKWYTRLKAAIKQWYTGLQTAIRYSLIIHVHSHCFLPSIKVPKEREQPSPAR